MRASTHLREHLERLVRRRGKGAAREAEQVADEEGSALHRALALQVLLEELSEPTAHRVRCPARGGVTVVAPDGQQPREDELEGRGLDRIREVEEVGGLDEEQAGTREGKYAGRRRVGAALVDGHRGQRGGVALGRLGTEAERGRREGAAHAVVARGSERVEDADDRAAGECGVEQRLERRFGHFDASRTHLLDQREARLRGLPPPLLRPSAIRTAIFFSTEKTFGRKTISPKTFFFNFFFG